MKHNLLETFDTEVKPGLFNAFKQDNPSTEKTIFQHLSIVHASILGGLIQKSKKENGTKAIKNLIELGNHKGDILDHIEEIFASKQRLTDIKKLGNSLLSFVFDEGADTAFERIQHFLSDKYETTEEDLIEVNRVVAPFSMALFGQIVHFDKLTEPQIKSLLEFNESIISKRYPGLAKVLGLQMPTEVQESSTPAGEEANQEAEPALKNSSSDKPNSSDIEIKAQEREAFLKALWPWVLLLIISGIALFILRKYEDDSVETKPENTFPFIQNDSVVLDVEKTYSLPGDIFLTVDRNGTLDSIMMHVENNQGISDTLRFKNSIIKFENSTSVLTSNANTELGGIVTILQAHPTIQMEIDMHYDSTFYNQHRDVVSGRIQNLSNYFNVFGLDNSRYEITSTIHPNTIKMDGSDSVGLASDTIINSDSSKSPIEARVDLKFFQQTNQVADSLNIQ
ncbi:MAG TPA: DUF937 domain-containing protein [Membranihabitans sp.]|nr:DUF937 domain-containing protein [Membranihabitans sp.]